MTNARLYFRCHDSCPCVSVRVSAVSVWCPYVSVRCPYDVRARTRTEGSGDKWDQHWHEHLETNEEAATEEILRPEWGPGARGLRSTVRTGRYNQPPSVPHPNSMGRKHTRCGAGRNGLSGAQHPLDKNVLNRHR